MRLPHMARDSVHWPSREVILVEVDDDMKQWILLHHRQSNKMTEDSNALRHRMRTFPGVQGNARQLSLSLMVGGCSTMSE